MGSFKDAMSKRQSDLNQKTTYPSLAERLAPQEKMLQVRILQSEMTLLDDFCAATELSRTQVVRAAIHLLRDPGVAPAVAQRATELPSRMGAQAAQKAAAWVEQQAEEEE